VYDNNNNNNNNNNASDSEKTVFSIFILLFLFRLWYRREFQLVSEMHGKVLDVRGGNKDPGANVIVYGKHSPPSKNQLWYLDHQGLIRSTINDFALDASKTLRYNRPVPYTVYRGNYKMCQLTMYCH